MTAGRFPTNPIPFMRVGVTSALLVLNTAWAGETRLLSISSTGEYDNAGVISEYHDLSETGVAVFKSRGSNLVPDDLNGQEDIFAHDTITGETTLISVATDGTQSNGLSGDPSISDDGRRVVFNSLGSNLDPADDNTTMDVFLHDRDTATTRMLTFARESENGRLGGSGGRSGYISGDGSTVAFSSASINLPNQSSPGATQAYIMNLDDDSLELVSFGANGPGNGGSSVLGISFDGQVVLFASSASNLVPGDTNDRNDVYVHDRSTGTTELISQTPAGIAGDGFSFESSIDDSGNVVAFGSSSTDLLPGANSDTNDTNDTFVRNRALGTTRRASESSAGEQGNAISNYSEVSGDGQSVVFTSNATNFLPDVSNVGSFGRNTYIKNLVDDSIELISVDVDGDPAGRSSAGLAVDRTGRRVAFGSSANDLIEPGPQANSLAYLRDRGPDCNIESSAHRFPMVRNVWFQLSLPCEPPPGTTLAELFADDISGDYKTTWAVFTYNAGIQDYDYLELSDILVPGQAFWIIQFTDVPVELDLPAGSRAVASNFDGGTACTGTIGCQNFPVVGSVTVRPGWNMLGNPFSERNAAEYPQVSVSTDTGACSSGCTLTEARAARVVSNQLFFYNGEINDYDDLTDLPANTPLQTWQGFWLAGFENAVDNGTTLHVPENGDQAPHSF